MRGGELGARQLAQDLGDVHAGESVDGGRQLADQLGDLAGRAAVGVGADQDYLVHLSEGRRHLGGNLEQCKW